ncbi:MAG: carboxylate--amine ligase [Gemmatales bacterium]|nr:MAG: carboxylate--amine ligase [Gemmatales bacterium]
MPSTDENDRHTISQMHSNSTEWLQIRESPDLRNGTLVLAFSGWMDGGDVSTGTVTRLVDLLEARPIAEIDPEPFYIYNFPGSMEVAALFRPHIRIDDGIVEAVEMPSNVFYCKESEKLLLFVGKEPNLLWRTFAACIFEIVQRLGISRIIFVGSFGGTVPHTREPRLYVTCSEKSLIAEMQQYGVRRSGYEGPGSFTSYLMTQAPAVGLKMTSLVAEIPGYLQGTNPLSIEAVTRRLAKILKLPLDLASLRQASTEWELRVTAAIEQDEELARRVRQLEEDYDNELLKEQEE